MVPFFRHIRIPVNVSTERVDRTEPINSAKPFNTFLDWNPKVFAKSRQTTPSRLLSDRSVEEWSATLTQSGYFRLVRDPGTSARSGIAN